MLTNSLYFISHSTNAKIKKHFGFNLKKVKKANKFVKAKLQLDFSQFCKNLNLEKDFKNNASIDINFLKDIRSFKGFRHINKLPCRGQRTRTNAKTRKRVLI